MEVTLSRKYRVAITLNRGDIEQLHDLLTQVGIACSYWVYTGNGLIFSTEDFDEFLSYLNKYANDVTEARLASSSFGGRAVTVCIKSGKITPIVTIIHGDASEVTYIDNRLSEWVDQVKQAYSWIACLELKAPWYYTVFILAIVPGTLWLYPIVESMPLVIHFWPVMLVILLLCGLLWRRNLFPTCTIALDEGINQYDRLAFLRLVYTVFIVSFASTSILMYMLYFAVK